MKRLAFVLSIGVLAGMVGYWSPGFGQEQTNEPPAGTLHDGSAFRFERITDDIYHVRGAGTMSVGSNSVVIINEEDVLLVDSNSTPAAAWVLREELRAITTKPVKYVVNTHFHFDHAHGNQIWGPDVELIGHEFTREALSDAEAIFASRTYQGFTGNVPSRIDGLRARIDAEQDPVARTRLESQLQVQESYRDALAEVNPTPPRITLDRKMTLFWGGREIQLMFLGRGHTGGDLVVYLPEEQVLCSGDLLVENLVYMGDGYVDEWADTLDELRSFDYDRILPGHGASFTGTQKIDNFQDYLRDFWTKATALRSQGLSAEQAAERIDMTNHRANYGNLRGPGVDVREMLRAYERMDEPENR